jgi:hypothetical protein
MKDVLKLALEALQWSKPHEDAVITHSEAITAIKAALAQPAQEPVMTDEKGRPITFWGGKSLETVAQPAQEPVAWMREDATLRFAEGKVFAVGQPFYTTSQQRPWVDLTFAQICEAEVIATDGFNNFSELKFSRAIEAKLKEINT